MKIAIPTDDKTLNSNICASFGRAPYYLIYDTDTKESKFIENSAAQSAGGAGIKAAQIISDSNADAVIAPRCGENAADVLKQSNINIFKSKSADIAENLSAFAAKELSLLDEIHSGYHGRNGNER
ncbi:MAG: NifB/NifX family molybdenum-iron cluster-binding protein [Firmicutes bacterium]|nr:NifB/NifX family molybdenum-iron cluster-binding protein [Bacillota bacterium]